MLKPQKIKLSQHLFSRFSFIVENVNKIGISKSIFSSLQLDRFSVFFFHLDQIGANYFGTKKSSAVSTAKVRRASADDYSVINPDSDEKVINVFDDYQYDESNMDSAASDDPNYEYQQYDDESQVLSDTAYNQWLCLPELSFKNVRLDESSLVQIHFTQIDLSLSISQEAFSEIQLKENSKFQLMFQDIKGHLVFDRESINNVKLSAGLFEIWIDNHRQKVEVRGSQSNETSSQIKFNPKHKSKSMSSQESFSSVKSAIRVLNMAKNNYLKFFDFAISNVFLNSRSNFRIGFLNSDSIMLLTSKSIRNFHVDRFTIFFLLLKIFEI